MIKVKDLKVGQMYKNAAGVFFHIVSYRKIPKSNKRVLTIFSSASKDKFEINDNEFADWINSHHLEPANRMSREKVDSNKKSAEWYEKKLVNITSKQKEYREKILTLKNRIETYIETDQLNIESLRQAECTIFLREDESVVFIKRYPRVFQRNALKADPQYEKLVSEFMKYGSIYRNYTKIYIQTRADYKKYYPKEFLLKREW